jgi:hypothetical protein
LKTEPRATARGPSRPSAPLSIAARLG